MEQLSPFIWNKNVNKSLKKIGEILTYSDFIKISDKFFLNVLHCFATAKFTIAIKYAFKLKARFFSSIEKSNRVKKNVSYIIDRMIFSRNMILILYELMFSKQNLSKKFLILHINF